MSSCRDFAGSAGLAALTMTCLLTAQGGMAKEAPVTVHGDPSMRIERVSFANLDLADARDARRLHLKVAGAVKRVCLFDTDRAKIQAPDYYSCADGAWGRARPQIDRAIAQTTSVASLGASIATSITVIAFAR